MSASDSEDDLIGTRRPSRPALFAASDSDSDSSRPAPAPRRAAARQDKANAHVASARRAAPRFLGDDADADDGLDDLFGDISSVTNSRAPMPARLDPHALDGLLSTAPAATKGVGAAQQEADSVWLNGDENGVDGVVAKKKRVMAKMDDVRLLGPNGFPKLMGDIKRVRLKGKGYERKDLKRLLSMYQLWAHQMYPKYNLRDSLVAVEKLCHKRTVQTELRRYRQEAKEAARPVPPAIDDDALAATTTTTAAAAAAAAAAAELETLEADDAMFDFDEDEEAMLAELEGGASAAPRPAAPRPPPPAAKTKAAVPEEDDFDAMEEEALRAVQQEFDIDEDEEAMLREMDEMM